MHHLTYNFHELLTSMRHTFFELSFTYLTSLAYILHYIVQISLEVFVQNNN